MRPTFILGAIPSLMLLAPSTPAQSWKLKAIDSVAISRVAPQVFPDNRMRVSKDPVSSSYRDIYSAWKFDLTGIPDTTQLLTMRLTLYYEVATNNPFGSPKLSLHHSTDDAWTRTFAKTTSAAPGKRVADIPKTLGTQKQTFTIDLSAHDFRTDLKDNALTFVLDNVNQTRSWAWFYGHTGSPTGPNAELEITACRGSITTFGRAGTDCAQIPHALSATGCPSPAQKIIIDAKSGTWISLPILVFLGLSDKQFGPVKLPLDLTPYGAALNSLYVSPDFLLGVIPNSLGGGGQMPFAIPNQPTLRGVNFYLQSILYGCGATNIRLVFSNGVKVTIG